MKNAGYVVLGLIVGAVVYSLYTSSRTNGTTLFSSIWPFNTTNTPSTNVPNTNGTVTNGTIRNGMTINGNNGMGTGVSRSISYGSSL